MEISFLIKGLIIGLSIAAPVGPIGVLCIQRTITYGKTSGLVTGLGAATADGLYGAIAAFGLTIITNFLVGQQFWFRLIGGTFLLYLGIRTFLSQPTKETKSIAHKDLLSDYVSTVFLTITNPTTILSFIAVFAGLGLGSIQASPLSSVLIVVGVVTGSALWWLLLSSTVSLLKTKFNTSSCAIVNKISGSIILIFGILALISIAR